MKATITALAALAAAGCATSPATSPLGHHVVPGSFVANRGPDGNSVFLDAPEGLILIDTGRHPAHRDKLLAYARHRGAPIIAVFNTHWHLDHTTNNAEIRSAHPRAQLYATTAIEGALAGFFPRSRALTREFLDSGRATAEQRAEIERAFQVMDQPEQLRPSRPVTEPSELVIGGRKLRLNIAPFAATEADLWLYDEQARLAIVGDLVVASVPFMDTACPDGWRRALDRLAGTPFLRLIPGHGEPMDRAQFLVWRAAFHQLLDCAASVQSRRDCIHGWRRDAAIFIPAGDEERIGEMVGYYLDTRLRAAPEERERYCTPGT